MATKKQVSKTNDAPLPKGNKAAKKTKAKKTSRGK